MPANTRIEPFDEIPYRSPSRKSDNGQDINSVAATLYFEMNRCIKVGNLKAFREAIAVVKEILARGDLPGFL